MAKIPDRDRPELKRRLLVSLGKGRGQALPCRIIARQCGYDADGDDRKTRIMIRDLIAEGYPIASTTGIRPGFFLAETPQEVKDYAQNLRKRLIEDAIRRRDFLRASRKILQPEQLKMGV